MIDGLTKPRGEILDPSMEDVRTVDPYIALRVEGLVRKRLAVLQSQRNVNLLQLVRHN